MSVYKGCGYRKKVEILPNLIREVLQDTVIKTHYHVDREDYSKNKTGSKSDKSLYRTRNNLKNLIDCNVCEYSKFVTFTFKEDIKDYNVALYHWKQLQKNYKRYYNEPLKFVAVMELQNGSARHGKTKETARNVWHFHAIIFNKRKLDFKILDSKLWGCGHCNTKVVDSTANLGRYLMKYITKDTIDVELNKKLILRSRNLKKPITFTFLELQENVPFINKGDLTFEKDIDYDIPQYIDKKTGELVPSRHVTRVIREYKRLTK